MKTKILNIILLFIGFGQIGCIVTAPPTVYTDPPYHTSSFNKVKESQFSFMSFSSNGTGSSLGFRFNHLYNSNLIFGVQTFWASRPMVMYGDNVISDTDSVDNAISYHEIAFGYDHLLNRYINMTIFGGLGVGSLKAQYAGKMNFVNNTQQLKEQFKTSYFRPFIQGNVIWSSKYIDTGIMGRIAHFQTFDPIEFGKNSRFIDNFLGYGFFVRIGSEKFQIEIQRSLSFSLNKTINEKYYSIDTRNTAFSVMLIR